MYAFLFNVLHLWEQSELTCSRYVLLQHRFSGKYFVRASCLRRSEQSWGKKNYKYNHNYFLLLFTCLQRLIRPSLLVCVVRARCSCVLCVCSLLVCLCVPYLLLCAQESTQEKCCVYNSLHNYRWQNHNPQPRDHVGTLRAGYVCVFWFNTKNSTL